MKNKKLYATAILFLLLCCPITTIFATGNSQAKNDLSQQVMIEEAEAFPALIYGKSGSLLQPIQVVINNPTDTRQRITVQIDKSVKKQINLEKGSNTIDLTLPEATATEENTIYITRAGKSIGEMTISRRPIKKWKVYLIQHTHTDIGYTKPQTEILTEHIRYIDYAIEYCELTKDYPDDAKFRWTCEAAWAVAEYLKNRPQEQIDKLKKYIDAGQIEVMGMFFNMSEIVDENSLKTFMEPIREFRKHDIEVVTAMQNDVNGIAWCMADYFHDLGIKYLVMGEHGHRAIIPFDKPTVFNWESPSGKSVYTFRADHYHTGNFWGVHDGDAGKVASPIFGYLKNLEDKAYPHDMVSVQYSGYWTDNSPPSIRESDLVKAWNEKYAYPKLRCALPHEFMDYVTANDGDKLKTYRVAYPDWWTDGFGSAARETAASRKTHADMVTVEGMLSMGVLKGKQLFPQVRDKIKHIHENLLFYDEHTFGAAESISDPLGENTQVQWAEKSAYAWEALKSAQMLHESAAGLLQNDLSRGEYPTITFFNSLGWDRSSLKEVYIDFEVIPANKSFRIISKDGRELKKQALRSRREGTYYAIYAEKIPAMGYRTYDIVVEATDVTQAPKTTMDQNVIENDFYKVSFDPVKGAIKSILDKQLQKELVDSQSPWQMGAFVYETLGNRHQLERFTLTDYQRNGLTDCKIEPGNNGPIYQNVFIEGKSAGCDEQFGVRLEVKLFHDTKRIEFAYALKREPVIDPSGIYIAFPFNMDKGKIAFEVQGGLLTCGENQLEGTASDWNTVQNFVTVKNGDMQYIIGSDNIPLFQLGDINLGKFQYHKSYEKPHIYSWVMNNYWVTNFRATQEGELRWNYYLTSTDNVSNTEATKFGWNSRIPLYARVMPEGEKNNNPIDFSAFRFDKENLLMTSCSPSVEDGYVLLNVRELDGRETDFSVFDTNGNRLTFSVVNIIGEPVLQNIREMKFKPLENKFIKLKLE